MAKPDNGLSTASDIACAWRGSQISSVRRCLLCTSSDGGGRDSGGSGIERNPTVRKTGLKGCGGRGAEYGAGDKSPTPSDLFIVDVNPRERESMHHSL